MNEQLNLQMIANHNISIRATTHLEPVWVNISNPSPQGLALSGGDNEESCNAVRAAMVNGHPGLSQGYYVTCDTEGSVATACENGW